MPGLCGGLRGLYQALPLRHASRGPDVRANDREQQFLAKAAEADEQAKATEDEFIRQAWERIAQDYRDLARLQQRLRD